ncbi:AP-3 complex subunit mu-1 isoform X4 [Nasonia vitripennis]|uniref:MHD domain-containing protein n=1 Tax=Nasonia vitripennis TaxID=7425 RepID=A0A7M7QLC4_NASVI|nr:AP-3 complex subunit mu-1 isoform X4 [Nasonia vitripennis]
MNNFNSKLLYACAIACTRASVHKTSSFGIRHNKKHSLSLIGSRSEIHHTIDQRSPLTGPSSTRQGGNPSRGMIGAMPAVAVRHERRRQENRTKRPSQLYLGGQWTQTSQGSPLTPSSYTQNKHDESAPEVYLCGKKKKPCKFSEYFFKLKPHIRNRDEFLQIESTINNSARTSVSLILLSGRKWEGYHRSDVFMEKHWKSAVARSLCDYFFDQQHKASNPDDTPPVIATPHHYLISIHRCSMFFVAVCISEVPTLFVIEFLHRVVDTFEDYFGECSETIIKENYVVVYELLDEMLDNGFPLATESNILKELIKPPTILRSIANTVTGKSNVSSTLPSGQLSNVPWRRSGVKYTNNEAYFDIIEEVDAIIDRTGATVFAEIQGYIDCCIKLSGMPDLTLSFVNSRLFDDVSFHPCVRFKRWESEKILSFIPPDGNFRLLSYHVGSHSIVAVPLYVKHNINLKEAGGGRLDITVGPKQTIGRIVHFTINQLALSGLKVNRLDMYGEKYKPFKGVKYVTKAGKFQMRL